MAEEDQNIPGEGDPQGANPDPAPDSDAGAAEPSAGPDAASQTPDAALDAASDAAERLADDAIAESAAAAGGVTPEQAEAAEEMDPQMAALLAATRAAVASAASGQGAPPPSAAPQPDLSDLADLTGGFSDDSAGSASGFDFPDLSAAGAPANATPAEYELLKEVNLNVKIELGRTRMLLEDVLKLGDGAVVELDKLAGDPVDVYVNDQRVATGEVLVLNDNFCVRISEIIDPHGEDKP